MKPLSVLLCVTFVSSVLSFLPAQAQTIYGQSLQTALARTTPHLEILLLDLRTHQPLANTFAHPDTPIPVGSLLKPFLALAYARSHANTFPAVVCHGKQDQCWKPGGHGAIILPEAIAQSCNAYFLTLARALSPAAIPYLPSPPSDATPETLIGLTPDWPIAPSALAQAYAALLTAPDDITHEEILAGMRASAVRGTANRIGPHHGGVLAKTGTAPCIDPHCIASGDGLVLAAFPADHPTLLLLVRKRATTGALTAQAARPILTQLESLHAY